MALRGAAVSATGFLTSAGRQSSGWSVQGCLRTSEVSIAGPEYGVGEVTGGGAGGGGGGVGGGVAGVGVAVAPPSGGGVTTSSVAVPGGTSVLVPGTIVDSVPPAGAVFSSVVGVVAGPFAGPSESAQETMAGRAKMTKKGPSFISWKGYQNLREREISPTIIS